MTPVEKAEAWLSGRQPACIKTPFVEETTEIIRDLVQEVASLRTLQGKQRDNKRRNKMKEIETIRINEIEYVRADSISTYQPTGNIKIVILPRGWNMIGYFSKEGSNCKLENASVIRRWGTTKGLGELAEKGKLKDTILDPCGTVEFHELTVIATIAAKESVWKSLI